jgi:hypothetical protein
MSGGDRNPNQAIYLRLEAGEEGAALSLDREVFGDAVATRMARSP